MILCSIIDVLSLSTYLAKAYNGCGIAYAELRKYEKAIENFEEAIKLRRYLIDSGSRTLLRKNLLIGRSSFFAQKGCLLRFVRVYLFRVSGNR